MKKCCFIIPYFGKLPKSFEMFIKSCAYNIDFDWLLFTDDTQKFNYPTNIKIVRMQLSDVKKLAEEKFGFPIALDYAYKLCDYKPAYGFVFEDYIKDYMFWGHCDIDTIMGDLSVFLTNELLQQYDKLFCMGHMVLYRNTEENNRVFMNALNGEEIYKAVFSTNDICVFDEEWNGIKNVNRIFLNSGKRVLQKDWSANFNVYSQNFLRNTLDVNPETGFIVHSEEVYIDALYFWDHGHACRIFVEHGELVREEFLYMHFQWRKMRIGRNVLKDDKFKIVPNAFLQIDKIPKTVNEFSKIKRNTICFYKQDRWIKDHIIRRFKKLKKIIFKCLQGDSNGKK